MSDENSIKIKMNNKITLGTVPIWKLGNKILNNLWIKIGFMWVIKKSKTHTFCPELKFKHNIQDIWDTDSTMLTMKLIALYFVMG